MVIIDFSATPKQALRHGFIKGLSSPIMLFDHFDAPPAQEVKQIAMPIISPAQALINDWRTIGNDLNKVIANYGKIPVQDRD
jgi:hypothetical protein